MKVDGNFRGLLLIDLTSDARGTLSGDEGVRLGVGDGGIDDVTGGL